MITADQIPDEVVEALGAALGNLRPTWDYAEAITTAINAWPDIQGAWYEGDTPTAYILPLTQEKK